MTAIVFGSIVSFLSMALALVGLFVDKNSPSFRFILPAFILLAFGLFCSQVVSEVLQKNESDAQSEEATQQRIRLLSVVDGLSQSSVRVTGYLSNVLLSQPQILADFGLTEERAGKPLAEVSIQDLNDREIIDANTYLAELASLGSASGRTKTRLVYYTKELDDSALLLALNELGYPVDERSPSPAQADQLSNAIWFGPDVDLTDYKIVLVSLIRAGIPIIRTAPVCENVELKSGRIEIGASLNAVRAGLQPITIERVRAAQTFDDLANGRCPK